jgi:quercetin dioxygenase-like cupin family protein
MIVRNYLETAYTLGPSHGGQGQVKNVRLFEAEDFDTRLRFIYYLEMEPGTSIGYHQHGDNEEAYIVIEGNGLMTVNNEARQVKTGDVILNKPGWSHGLENTSDHVLKLLVFEVRQ